jgi:Flp pilus assembly pilin Flp
VRTRLLALGVRGHLLAADLGRSLMARVRDTRGQTTIEWIALMVGFTALVVILAGDDVWQKAGKAIVDAVNGIFSSDHDRV